MLDILTYGLSSSLIAAGSFFYGIRKYYIKKKNKKKEVLLRNIHLDEDNPPRYTRISLDDNYDYYNEENT